jgi:hypothetical protein
MSISYQEASHASVPHDIRMTRVVGTSKAISTLKVSFRDYILFRGKFVKVELKYFEVISLYRLITPQQTQHALSLLRHGVAKMPEVVVDSNKSNVLATSTKSDVPVTLKKSTVTVKASKVKSTVAAKAPKVKSTVVAKAPKVKSTIVAKAPKIKSTVVVKASKIKSVDVFGSRAWVKANNKRWYTQMEGVYAAQRAYQRATATALTDDTSSTVALA